MKKNKVGRPKLADKQLKKKSYIMLGISALLIMILLSGTLVSLNVLPKFNKTKGSVPIYKTYEVGDMFCLNGDKECFYTISDNGDTVTALAEKNVDTNTNRQSDNANTLEFANTNYWSSGAKDILEYIRVEDNEFCNEYGEDCYRDWYFLYNSSSSLYVPNENYKQYLNNELGKNVIKISLLNYNQSKMLNCTDDYYSDWCQNAPEWVYSQNTYWLGYSLSYNYSDYISYPYFIGNYLDYDYVHQGHALYGLRPVITIVKSDFAEIVGYEPEPETTTEVTTTQKQTTVATTVSAKNEIATTTKKNIVTTTTTETNKEEETTTTEKVVVNKVVEDKKKVKKDKESNIPVVPIAVGGTAAVAGIGYGIYLLKIKL